MKLQFRNWDIIEDYLDGRMNEQENREFEKRLKVDKELADEWELISLFTQAGKRFAREGFDQAYEQAKKEYSNRNVSLEDADNIPSQSTGEPEPAQQESRREGDSPDVNAWVRQIDSELEEEGFYEKKWKELVNPEPESPALEPPIPAVDVPPERGRESRPVPLRVNWKRALAIAAGIAVFPLIFFLIQNYYQGKNRALIADNNRRMIEEGLAPLIEQGFAGGDPSLRRALQLLSDGQADQAEYELRAYQGPNPDRANFYLAISLLSAGENITKAELEEAEKIFDDLINKESDLKEQAQWYRDFACPKLKKDVQ